MKATEKNENATETKSPDYETLFDVFRENRKKNRAVPVRPLSGDRLHAHGEDRRGLKLQRRLH